jgi:hypothetical protein
LLSLRDQRVRYLFNQDYPDTLKLAKAYNEIGADFEKLFPQSCLCESFHNYQVCIGLFTNYLDANISVNSSNSNVKTRLLSTYAAYLLDYVNLQIKIKSSTLHDLEKCNLRKSDLRPNVNELSKLLEETTLDSSLRFDISECLFRVHYFANDIDRAESEIANMKRFDNILRVKNRFDILYSEMKLLGLKYPKNSANYSMNNRSLDSLRYNYFNYASTFWDTSSVTCEKRNLHISGDCFSEYFMVNLRLHKRATPYLFFDVNLDGSIDTADICLTIDLDSVQRDPRLSAYQSLSKPSSSLLLFDNGVSGFGKASIYRVSFGKDFDDFRIDYSKKFGEVEFTPDQQPDKYGRIAIKVDLSQFQDSLMNVSYEMFSTCEEGGSSFEIGRNVILGIRGVLDPEGIPLNIHSEKMILYPAKVVGMFNDL